MTGVLLHHQRLCNEPQKAKIERKLMHQVKRKLNASCHTGFQDPGWESPLAWPPGWVECTAQSIPLTASQTPVSSWLKLWAPKLQGEPRIQWGWGGVLVGRWAVCHIGMFLSRNLGIVATDLALSSQWMAISPLTVQWVSCRNLSLNSSLGTASSSWPQTQNVRK